MIKDWKTKSNSSPPQTTIRNNNQIYFTILCANSHKKFYNSLQRELTDEVSEEQTHICVHIHMKQMTCVLSAYHISHNVKHWQTPTR